MKKLSAYFFSEYHLKTQTVWFKRLLYLFLIIESLYYLAYFDVLFGANSIVTVSSGPIGYFKHLAFILYDSEYTSFGFCFLLAVLCLSLLNLFTVRFALPVNVLLWFLMINIHNRIYPTLTGGSNLLNQLLFFNCFLSATFSEEKTSRNELKICLHNMGLLAIAGQICLLYLYSALAKFEDPQWVSGQAIATISQIQRFSLFSSPDNFRALNPALIFVNYVVLFYQLLFPVFIWISKIKKPLLIIGILMHLYIAFFMGLVSFGFVMILGYVFFWPVKSAKS
ncbi:hypothetical protein CNR22_08280 [Sphingobacteriaceae bacterium]|nr:hypothetical protein CNR22_08280 [Sphingobacteriaceae bacterium]